MGHMGSRDTDDVYQDTAYNERGQLAEVGQAD